MHAFHTGEQEPVSGGMLIKEARRVAHHVTYTITSMPQRSLTCLDGLDQWISTLPTVLKLLDDLVCGKALMSRFLKPHYWRDPRHPSNLPTDTRVVCSCKGCGGKKNTSHAPSYIFWHIQHRYLFNSPGLFWISETSACTQTIRHTAKQEATSS